MLNATLPLAHDALIPPNTPYLLSRHSPSRSSIQAMAAVSDEFFKLPDERPSIPLAALWNIRCAPGVWHFGVTVSIVMFM